MTVNGTESEITGIPIVIEWMKKEVVVEVEAITEVIPHSLVIIVANQVTRKRSVQKPDEEVVAEGTMTEVADHVTTMIDVMEEIVIVSALVVGNHVEAVVVAEAVAEEAVEVSAAEEHQERVKAPDGVQNFVEEMTGEILEGHVAEAKKRRRTMVAGEQMSRMTLMISKHEKTRQISAVSYEHLVEERR